MQKIKIRVKGHIDKQWSHWFGDLNIRHSATGETILCGLVSDQAALYGIITRLRDLGLQLNSVCNEDVDENDYE
jgi:hypothetical protein